MNLRWLFKAIVAFAVGGLVGRLVYTHTIWYAKPTADCSTVSVEASRKLCEAVSEGGGVFLVKTASAIIAVLAFAITLALLSALHSGNRRFR